jgi:hypothetical protein
VVDGNSARPGRIALGLTALAAQRLIRHPGRATRAVLSSTIVARSGAEARALIRAAVDRALGWAGRTAAPRVIDIMLPHLEERVVPELIDAAMPLLHAKVVPAIIEDLIDSPLVRTLLLEQSRGVVSHTADQLRDATARADGRVEDAVHNLVRRSRGR